MIFSHIQWNLSFHGIQNVFNSSLMYIDLGSLYVILVDIYHLKLIVYYNGNIQLGPLWIA